MENSQSTAPYSRDEYRTKRGTLQEKYYMYGTLTGIAHPNPFRKHLLTGHKGLNRTNLHQSRPVSRQCYLPIWTGGSS
jgi:hypothetical protein